MLSPLIWQVIDNLNQSLQGQGRGSNFSYRNRGNSDGQSIGRGSGRG